MEPNNPPLGMVLLLPLFAAEPNVKPDEAFCWPAPKRLLVIGGGTEGVVDGPVAASNPNSGFCP